MKKIKINRRLVYVAIIIALCFSATSVSDKKQREKAPEKEVMALEIYQKIEETVKRLNATIDKNMRVGCLTTSKDDIRMWSYYANGHQGICIEYDYSQVTFSPKTTFPLPVIYSERRPTMPWRSVINNTEDNHNQDNRELAIGLLHKGQSWQDEKEWRIIIDSKQSQNFKMPPIKCIYLGAKIPDVEKALICQIAKDKNIPVKQMVLSETGFVLQAKAIVS